MHIWTVFQILIFLDLGNEAGVTALPGYAHSLGLVFE